MSKLPTTAITLGIAGVTNVTAIWDAPGQAA
jgi:hypothetical protein